MFRAKKTKRNIKEHAEHCCLIEYGSALLWNSVTKTRPAKATRPLGTGIEKFSIGTKKPSKSWA